MTYWNPEGGAGSVQNVEIMMPSETLTFIHYDLQAGLTNQDLQVVGNIADDTVVKDGYIIAHYAEVDTAITAGTIDIMLTRNGVQLVDVSLNLQLSPGTDKLRADTNIHDPNFAFNQDDTIVSQITTSAGYLPLGNILRVKILVDYTL